MSVVRVYKSTDVDAPAHPNQTMGDLAALMRACLVTGYGTGIDEKLPAGWTEPYAEANGVAMFRAASGHQQFYKVDDSVAYDARVAVVRGAEAAANVNDLTGEWGVSYFGKRASNTTAAYNPTGWVVIADELTAYLFLNPGTGSEGEKYYPHAIGEFFPYPNNEVNRSLLGGHFYSLGMYVLTSVNLTNTMQMVKYNSIYNIPTFLHNNSIRAKGYLYGLGGIFPGASDTSSTITNAVFNSTGATADSIVAEGSYGVSNHLLKDMTSKSKLVGEVRGFYWPLVATPKVNQAEFVFEGKNFIALNVGYVYNNVVSTGQVWVDITGSWPKYEVV